MEWFTTLGLMAVFLVSGIGRAVFVRRRSDAQGPAEPRDEVWFGIGVSVVMAGIVPFFTHHNALGWVTAALGAIIMACAVGMRRRGRPHR